MSRPAALTSALAAALLLLLSTATPALAQAEELDGPAVGFPVALLALVVGATVLALVWRALSKRKQEQDQ